MIEVSGSAAVEGSGGTSVPPQSDEIWLPVIGFEGLYSVSNMGRIKSHPKKIGNGAIRQERIIKGSIKKSGYVRVRLHKDGMSSYHSVHRLVLEAHERPAKEGELGLHRNNVRSDNRLSNLRWGDHADNMSDREASETVAKGNRIWSNILTEDQVREIRSRLKSGDTQERVAKDFNVSPTQVHNILHRKHWKYI